MQQQRTQLAKRLAAVLATAEKRMQGTLAHPLPQLMDIHAARPNVGVHVEIHVQRRIPPPAETAHEKRCVAEFGAVARLEVVDEAGVFAHGGFAAPARHVGGAMLGHVLTCC